MNDLVSAGLSTNLVKYLQKSGFSEATPTQDKTIAAVLSLRDLVVVAHTGSGKTLGWMWAVLEMSTGSDSLSGAALYPDHQAAAAAFGLWASLQSFKDIKAVLVTEVSWEQQAPSREDFADAALVFGTPGAVGRAVQVGLFHPQTVRLLVIEEAHSLSAKTVGASMDYLRERLATGHQTLLTAQVETAFVKVLVGEFLNNPKEIYETFNAAVDPRIDEMSLLLELKKPQDEKALDALRKSFVSRLIEEKKTATAVIFTRTKASAKSFVRSLASRKKEVAGFYEDMAAPKKAEVLQAFLDGKTAFIVCSDPARDDLKHSGIAPKIGAILHAELPTTAGAYFQRLAVLGTFPKEAPKIMSVALVAPVDENTWNGVLQMKRAQQHVEQIPPKGPAKAGVRSASQGRRTPRSESRPTAVWANYQPPVGMGDRVPSFMAAPLPAAVKNFLRRFEAAPRRTGRADSQEDL